MIEDIDPSWQRIELRHLVALNAVAATGSFRAAAQRLGYSVSTLSEQVASLERLVSQPLFVRPGGRRAVTITPAGERLLDHADEIGARIAAACADLKAIQHNRPLLRLGLFQSPAVRLLPSILRTLGTTRPELELELIEREDDASLLQLVESGEIDACFVILPVEKRQCVISPLLEDPYFVLVAADGPFGARSTITLSELAELPLIDYREIRAACHARHRLPTRFRPRIVVRTDDNMTIHALVSAGVGVALVPRLCVDLRGGSVRALIPDPLVEARTIAVAWHQDRAPDGLSDFLDAAKVAARISNEPPDSVPMLSRAGQSTG